MRRPGMGPWHHLGDNMKKRSVKKLTLAKETVRHLNVEKSHVAGGVQTESCNCETYYSCNTVCQSCYCSASCEWTCTCNSNVFACPITAGDTCIGC